MVKTGAYSLSTSFQHFNKPVSADDVVAAVRVLPDKSCASDPLRNNPLKAVVDITAPFLTNLFNSFMANGLVPEAFTAAFISPRLKKSGLDPADVRSHIATNFQFIGRVEAIREASSSVAGPSGHVWLTSAASIDPTILLRRPC